LVVLGGAVVLEVAALVELVAADELEVAAAVVVVAPELVLVVELFATVVGVVTTELDGALCWKMIRSTTVSASTPTTTPIAVQISCRLRTGCPCASRRSGRRRLLISSGSYR
jgi:hypothetical protein